MERGLPLPPEQLAGEVTPGRTAALSFTGRQRELWPAEEERAFERVLQVARIRRAAERRRAPRNVSDTIRWQLGVDQVDGEGPRPQGPGTRKRG
jgi:hypothetical protein